MSRKPVTDELSELRRRLRRDLAVGTQTAKVVWRTTLAPQLRDLSRLARTQGGRLTRQAGGAFTELGRRLRNAGDKLDND